MSCVVPSRSCRRRRTSLPRPCTSRPAGPRHPPAAASLRRVRRPRSRTSSTPSSRTSSTTPRRSSSTMPPMMKTWSAIVVSAALTFAGGCGKGDKKAAASIAQKDGADGLKALFEASHAACKGKDFAKGKAIVMGMLPGKDQLRKVLKDDAPGDKIDALVAQYKEVPPSDEKVACIFAPEGRTEIK